MNVRFDHPRVRGIVALGTSIALIFLLIAGLQPLLDFLLADGTLFASPVQAQEQDPGSAPTPEGTPSEERGEPQARQSETSSPDLFRDNPLAMLALSLQEKQLELSDRERELKRRESELGFLKTQIEEKLEYMETVKTELVSLTVQIDAERKKKVKSWVAIYEGMQPANASVMLAAQEDDLTLEVLLQMTAKKASAILDAMVSSTDEVISARAIKLAEGLRKARR